MDDHQCNHGMRSGSDRSKKKRVSYIIHLFHPLGSPKHYRRYNNNLVPIKIRGLNLIFLCFTVAVSFSPLFPPLFPPRFPSKMPIDTNYSEPCYPISPALSERCLPCSSYITRYQKQACLGVCGCKSFVEPAAPHVEPECICDCCDKQNKFQMDWIIAQPHRDCNDACEAYCLPEMCAHSKRKVSLAQVSGLTCNVARANVLKG